MKTKKAATGLILALFMQKNSGSLYIVVINCSNYLSIIYKSITDLLYQYFINIKRYCLCSAQKKLTRYEPSIQAAFCA